MSASAPKDLTDTLSTLTLTSKTPTKKKKKPVIADSWDDEDVSSGDDVAETPKKVPDPPPPTPMTPRVAAGVSQREPYVVGPDTFSRDGTERGERPTKTDAVARRMISAALGVRAKSTKEQKEYDNAVRTAEKKKRDEEKERKKAEEEEKERMKRAVWED